MNKVTCPKCQGQRLKKESLHFRIHGKNIAEVAAMSFGELHRWLEEVPDSIQGPKAVIADDQNRIVSRALAPTGFRLAEIAATLLEQAIAEAGLQRSDVEYVVSTGFGRTSSAYAPFVPPTTSTRRSSISRREPSFSTDTNR